MNMKYLKILIIAVAIGILHCSNNIEPTNQETKLNKVLFTLFKVGNNFELMFSPLDSIKFEKTGINIESDITSSLGAPRLFNNKCNNLLLLATEKSLYFINTTTNKIISKIDIPDNITPEPNIGYGVIDILPLKNNPNYCVLINRSVYLINIKNHQIEKVIWSCLNEDKIIFCNTHTIMQIKTLE